jgi:crotonobetainyl-CoA:carnitine CoA-transferase CaiB-like acyl-CoA transferase
MLIMVLAMKSRPRENMCTLEHDPEEAMKALQAVGIAAGVARLPVELLSDSQLHARGFIQEINRAFIGKHPQPSVPFREGGKPFPIRSAPPTLGEHNREILGGLLGLSDAELEQLARVGIIGTEMPTEEQLVEEKKRARLAIRSGWG